MFTLSPLMVAALWVLTSASWAILLPIQRAVVAEVNGHRVGRGLGLLTNFWMLGAAAGGCSRVCCMRVDRGSSHA
ncbi:hypothetical protein AR539_18360 [Arthrobacter sp. EPSL27]|nr:hypothetical protein AR539_18360 [Arthrobacter sp. EPSL27]